jgi:hypothetical protein
MNTERDKFLTETMGECWHEWTPTLLLQDYVTAKDTCKKCGAESNWYKRSSKQPPHMCIDFSTPDGFFKLWEWAQEQEWFNQIVDENTELYCELKSFINPDIFADAVYAFLKEQ